MPCQMFVHNRLAKLQALQQAHNFCQLPICHSFLTGPAQGTLLRLGPLLLFLTICCSTYMVHILN